MNNAPDMDVQAGVPQGSILGSQDNLISNPKLFTDDTSIFSVVTDPNAGANQININIHSNNMWAYQWKISFKPDTSKEAQVIFSHKIMVTAHPQLIFSKIEHMKPQLKYPLECFSNTS